MKFCPVAGLIQHLPQRVADMTDYVSIEYTCGAYLIVELTTTDLVQTPMFVVEICRWEQRKVARMYILVYRLPHTRL